MREKKNNFLKKSRFGIYLEGQLDLTMREKLVKNDLYGVLTVFYCGEECECACGR